MQSNLKLILGLFIIVGCARTIGDIALKIGNGTDVDIKIEAELGKGGSNPYLNYNASLNKFEVCNEGEACSEVGSLSSVSALIQKSALKNWTDFSVVSSVGNYTGTTIGQGKIADTTYGPQSSYITIVNQDKYFNNNYGLWSTYTISNITKATSIAFSPVTNTSVIVQTSTSGNYPAVYSGTGLGFLALGSTIAETFHFKQVVYGNGYFLAIGNFDSTAYGKVMVIDETDFSTYTLIDLPDTVNEQATWTNIVFIASVNRFVISGKYAAGANIGEPVFYTSDNNGSTWTKSDLSAITLTSTSPSIYTSYGNGKIVAVGGYGSGTTSMFISTDNGATFNETIVNNTFYKLQFLNGFFMAYHDATGSVGYISSDGVNWELINYTSDAYEGFSDVYYSELYKKGVGIEFNNVYFSDAI